MSEHAESEGDSIIVGPWTQAAHNLHHYFGSLISQINLVQNDINAANERLRTERDAYRKKYRETNDKFIEVAGLRVVLEQKVMRLEEAITLLTAEKTQLTADLSRSNSVRQQLKDSMRGSSLQYERLVDDLSHSESDLFTMKQRFTALSDAYKEATGREPPHYVAPEVDEDIPDSVLLQEHKRLQLQRKEELAHLTKVNQAPHQSDPSRYTNAQEEELRQEEEHDRLSPVRQMRATNGGRAEPKLRIIPTPPVLNLDGAIIEEPVVNQTQRNKGKQPASTNKPSTSSARSLNKPNAAAPFSRPTGQSAQGRYPTFLLNAETSPSTSRQTRTRPRQQPQQPLQSPLLLPAVHIHERREAHEGPTGTHREDPSIPHPSSSSANPNSSSTSLPLPLRHPSIVVQNHVHNALARRALTSADDTHDANMLARAAQEQEQKRARKAEHRKILEQAAKEMQIEMGVDLGDFPPEGEKSLRERWRTIEIGEQRHIKGGRATRDDRAAEVKMEQEEVRLRDHDARAGHQHAESSTAAARQQRQAPHQAREHQQADDGEEEMYDGERPVPDIPGYHQPNRDQQFPPSQREEYIFVVPANMSVAGATDGSESGGSVRSTLRKSKYGEDHGEEGEVDGGEKQQETRPTKRRRVETQQPATATQQHLQQQGPSNAQASTSTSTHVHPQQEHQQNQQQSHLAPKRRTSVRLGERRAQTAVAAAQQAQTPGPQTARQQQQRQTRPGEAGPGPGTAVSRRQAANRGTGRMLRGAAAGSQADLIRIEEEQEWMRSLPEVRPQPIILAVPSPPPVPPPGPFGPRSLRLSEEPEPALAPVRVPALQPAPQPAQYVQPVPQTRQHQRHPQARVPVVEVPIQVEEEESSDDDNDPIAGPDYVPRQRNPRVAPGPSRAQPSRTYRPGSPRPPVREPAPFR